MEVNTNRTWFYVQIVRDIATRTKNVKTCNRTNEQQKPS